MLKTIHIVGARPQFIKAAALSREMKRQGRFKEIIVHTGQHFDENMSEVFFREMEISKPDYNLEINSLTHGAMTGRMLEKVEKIFLDEKPDVVVIYGDTNSTLAGALAASKLHMKLAHVEAGLRSYNMKMPEEQNRILADRLSQFLFCPTRAAMDNLDKEGYKSFPVRVIQSGDVMLDAALYYAASSAQKSKIMQKLNAHDFFLCTLHRAENTDDPVRLRSIIHALNHLNKEAKVVLPLHPRTRKVMHQQGLHFEGLLLDPVGYFDMLELLKHCSLVLTDSGGLQKEAYFFRKYCVTLRDETEWTELVQLGFNKLAGAHEEKIAEAAAELKGKSSDFSLDIFGGGNACQVIAKTLLDYRY